MTHIEQRQDYAAGWVAKNPVLYYGEVGWEVDTNKAKKGNGVTAWNSLPYVILPPTDVSLLAPIASPAFTGNPTAPTPTPGDNDTSIATSAFVQAALTSLGIGNLAPKASPVFTGDPQAPTAAAADNDTSIATTAHVKLAIAAQALAPLASPTFTGDPKAPTPAAADNDTSIATTAHVKLAIAAAALAPLASPVFTGNPTGPTPAAGDNDTSLATTAFVQAALTALGLKKIQFGIVTLDPAGTSSATATVTYPTAFPTSPYGLAIMQNLTTSPIYVVKVNATTTTQITIRADNMAGTTHTGLRDCLWVAFN